MHSRYRKVAIVFIGALPSVLLPGRVLAQTSSDIPPVLASIIAKTATIVDGMLGYWISGGAVTDPLGNELAVSIAARGTNTFDFLERVFALPELPSVAKKADVILNGILGHWVSGNTLTDPSGDLLVLSLGTLAVNSIHFLAWLMLPFTFA